MMPLFDATTWETVKTQKTSKFQHKISNGSFFDDYHEVYVTMNKVLKKNLSCLETEKGWAEFQLKTGELSNDSVPMTSLYCIETCTLIDSSMQDRYHQEVTDMSC
jgi:hypothetical protein